MKKLFSVACLLEDDGYDRTRYFACAATDAESAKAVLRRNLPLVSRYPEESPCIQAVWEMGPWDGRTHKITRSGLRIRTVYI